MFCDWFVETLINDWKIYSSVTNHKPVHTHDDSRCFDKRQENFLYRMLDFYCQLFVGKKNVEKQRLCLYFYKDWKYAQRHKRSEKLQRQMDVSIPSKVLDAFKECALRI